MSDYKYRSHDVDQSGQDSRDAVPDPGKMTLTSRLAPQLASSLANSVSSIEAPLQLKPATVGSTLPWPSAASADDDWKSTAVVQRKESSGEQGMPDDHGTWAIAAQGISGASGKLSHAEPIIRSLGEDHRSTIENISAHTDGAAAQASSELGAQAYATGSHVALSPTAAGDLHTEAHEAAHVVQQKHGTVQCKAGVGHEDDIYERHADAIADKVVKGESAASLLQGPMVSLPTDQPGLIQRKPSKSPQSSPDAQKHVKLSYHDLTTQLAVGLGLVGQGPNGAVSRKEIDDFLNTSAYLVEDLNHWVDVLEDAGAHDALEWAKKATDLSGQIDGVRAVLVSQQPAPATKGASTSPPAQVPTVAPVPPSVSQGPTPQPAPVASTTQPTSTENHTGVPVVDVGTLCEHASVPPGSICGLTIEQRTRLLDAIRGEVQSSMQNYHDALGNKRTDLIAASKKSDWPVLLDLMLTIVVTPLGNDIGKLLVESLTADAKTVTEVVKNGLKWAQGMAKSAATSIPRGVDGAKMFLSIIASSLKPVASYISDGLPATLDDRALSSLRDYWSNPQIHSVQSYEGRVAAELDRFQTQVGSLGEWEPDRAYWVKQTAAATIKHGGRSRMALVSRQNGRISDGLPGTWRFQQWVDGDMAPLAKDAMGERFDGPVGPFDADDPGAGFERTDQLDAALAQWDAHAP